MVRMPQTPKNCVTEKTICVFDNLLGTIVVMDAYPLPVEGIEYKVEAAEEANTYMIQLLEALELRRKER